MFAAGRFLFVSFPVLKRPYLNGVQRTRRGPPPNVLILIVVGPGDDGYGSGKIEICHCGGAEG